MTEQEILQGKGCRAMVAIGFKPYALKTVNGQCWECISMPYPDDAGGVSIKIRQPDDPTTMIDLRLLAPDVLHVLDNQY